MTHSILQSSLFYNIDNGLLEAAMYGFRDGLLSLTDYTNFQQCENLEDFKLQLQNTDYGHFLQNEPQINSSIVEAQALLKLVDDFNWMRFHAVNPLSQFLDFISYEYMISNVLKLISASRQDRDLMKEMFKLNPLGLFENIKAIAAGRSVDEMYELVLVDSPIARFFTKMDMRDFDELKTDHLDAMLKKNYLESFYDFCEQLDGTSSRVMREILEFEADRRVLSMTRSNCMSKAIPKEDLKKLYPNFGLLVEYHSKLGDVDDPSQIKDIIRPFSEYYQVFDSAGQDYSFDTLFDKLAIERYKNMFTDQFNFGNFYAIVKLRQHEINSLKWICDCIQLQQMDLVDKHLLVAGGN